jgi:phosphatidylserine/phosphatidylglycerophosphate/cardiolipin synthase-like enzyme
MLQSSFSQQPLSRSERAALREQIEAAGLTAQQLSAARSMGFQQALQSVTSENAVAVIQWLDDVLKVLHPVVSEGADEVNEAWFSPGGECPQRIRSLLAQAKRSVEICVFTITDDRLTSAILDAHRRGVSVRIITDNDKAADHGSDADQLQAAGIPLRVDRSEYHMHHKFAVFDGNLLLNGSYNWTRGAAENNEENFVVTSNRRLLSEFQKVFESLWNQLGKF